MRSFCYRRAVVSMLAAAVCFTQIADAQFVPWTNSSGAGAFFTWQDGGSRHGRFGDPTLVGGDTFLFFPPNFRAESSGGGAVQVSDRLQVDLKANPGAAFTAIEISELGDYGIFGGPGEVAITGTAFATDLEQFRVRSDSLVSTPPSPIKSGQGEWTAEALVDLGGAPAWRHLRFTLDDNLLAISSPGGFVYVEKKIVAIRIIPEPGALGLLLTGVLVAGRRR